MHIKSLQNNFYLGRILCVKQRNSIGSGNWPTKRGGGSTWNDMDGHTEAGAPEVELDGIFSVDEVLQFIRSLDWALMMDSHEDKPGYPQRMDYIGHRAFLKGMRDKLYNALEEQLPELLKELHHP